jgi:GTP-dependent dephospho-CoA kinase
VKLNRVPLKFSSRAYRVPEVVRQRVKTPLGELIEDRFVTKEAISSRVPKKSARPTILVSVGDRSTERLVEFSIEHQLEIVDRVEKRNVRREIPFSGSVEKMLFAKNEPGTISAESLLALRTALDQIEEDPSLPIRIQIDGEEDLLTLPVLAYFPPETIVLYGQPGEGMVIVQAKGEPRMEAWDILADLGIRSL